MDKKLCLIFSLLIILASCVEPYDRLFGSSEEIITIEGKLSNISDGNFVKLTLSKPNATTFSFIRPIETAKVELLEGGSSLFSLTTGKDGFYLFPNNFSGKPNTIYQIKITLDDNRIFLSNEQRIGKSISINKVFHTIEREGINNFGIVEPAFLIFIDSTDPEDEDNFYKWDYALYEKQKFCATCNAGTILALGGSTECIEAPEFNQDFDYQCDRPCWEIKRNTDINIIKDEFITSGNISGKLVARIPIYQRDGALLKLSQLSISKETYDFLNIARSQQQNTGSLADSPPASLAGNVSEMGNPKNKMAGYFIVATEVAVDYWLDKKDVPEEIQTLGLLGRPFNLEPAGNSTVRPPMAPCLNSYTRTNSEPSGWINP